MEDRGRVAGETELRKVYPPVVERARLRHKSSWTSIAGTSLPVPLSSVSAPRVSGERTSRLGVMNQDSCSSWMIRRSRYRIGPATTDWTHCQTFSSTLGLGYFF